jgi:hypothetical protein
MRPEFIFILHHFIIQKIEVLQYDPATLWSAQSANQQKEKLPELPQEEVHQNEFTDGLCGEKVKAGILITTVPKR